jgi:hypothetical protein
MNYFEMRYIWDDPQQAAYSKTISFECKGLFKTWKLENETDEIFKCRSEKAAIEQLGRINRKSRIPALVEIFEFY